MIRELFLSDFPLSSCVWQSTIFLVVGLVSSFILRHRSARAHQVLFLAMMAAVIVPIMSILVKHYELGVFVAEPVVIQSRAEDVGRVGNFGAPGTISAEEIEHKPGTIEKDLQPATLASESTKLPWRSVVLYAWIAASLILATRLLVTFVLGARLLGRALPLKCQRIEEAARLARAKLGIDKDVMVRSSRGVRSPVIWCWRRRPVLLVPSATGRFDNGVDWAGVLCHELAHYKRRDHISGLLAELAVCILPWHPLVWWAKSRLVRLSERACDDWVVDTGQPCADYAESLLDLVPQGQMAFVPAVVSSKRGLAYRIRRILKDKCGNPRAGLAWALVVSIVAVLLAAGVAFAQTRPSKTEGQNAEEIELSRRRIISFPEDRSMGKLFARDSGQDSWYEGWQELGEAKGNVSVAAGKEVKLQISEQAAGDLTALDKLEADDLQMLSFGWKAVQVGSLAPIGNLKGLKALNIQRARFDSDDFKYLTGLAQLQVLRFGDYNLTDGSMRYVGQLTSLRSLALWGTGISDEGLKHLQGLTNLTFLALNRCEITDQGLNYLRNMTALEGLQISQTKITDNGLEKLRGLSRLKHVKLSDNGITDAGLKHIENLTSLENIWINSNPITDKGLSYLAGMKNLKQFYALHTEITDAGRANLKGVKDIRLVVGPRLGPRVSPRTAEKTKSARQRVVSFPEGRSMGKLFVRDAGPDSWYEGWQVLGEAKGDVSVDAGKEVKLQISEQAAGDLSVLDKLGPDDMQMLSFGWKPVKIGSLAPIGNLRALKALNLQTAKFNCEDFKHLTELSQLEVLRLGDQQLTDGSMQYIGQLISLRSLALWGTGISDEGLKHLRALTNLTFLALNGCKITDEGLGYLKNMTALEGLQLDQTKITDEGLAKLKIFNRLKSLLIGHTNITDAGLEHLQGLTSLENIWINSNPITDEGLAYLSGMKNLKELYATGTKITDAGLLNLRGLKDFRHLIIDSIGDEGIAHLSELPALKLLQIQDAQVTEASIPDFKKMESIKEVLLSGEQVDDELLDALRNPLPNCKIWDPQRSREYPMPTWRRRFEAVYRLEDGQILKRISPPFIPERRDYYVNELSRQASSIDRSPDRFVFHWDGKLKRWGYRFGSPDLNSALSHVFRLKSYEYELPEELLSLEIPGDWIIRDEAQQETKLKALEQLLADELGRYIRFEKRTVEREVIVATGRFRFRPLPEAPIDNRVYMFSDIFDDRGGGGGSAESVPEFLLAIGHQVGMPVVNKTQPSEETSIPYHHHRSSYLRRVKDKTEKAEKLRMMLDNLTKQTELQFEISLQPVEVWFVTEQNNGN